MPSEAAQQPGTRATRLTASDDMALVLAVYGGLLAVFGWLACQWEPGTTRTILLAGTAAGLFAGGLGFVAARRALSQWAAVVGGVVAGSLLVGRAVIAWMAVFDGRTEGVLNPLPMTVMLTISAVVAGYLFHAHKVDKAQNPVSIHNA